MIACLEGAIKCGGHSNFFCFYQMKSASLALLLLAGGANAIHIRGSEDPALAAAPAVAAVPTSEELNPLNVANPSGLAIQKLFESQKQVSELYAKSQATCATEQRLTVKWQNEVQDMGNKARRESKQQLLGALEKRLAGLKKFVRRLKVMRGRLREHIVRVNDIFTTKYTENLNNVHVASDVLQELAHIQTDPWNPHISPIKNFAALDAAADNNGATGAAAPAEAEGEAAEAEGDEANDSARTALIAISEHARTHGECKSATGAALNVYELGLKLNSMMDKSFENEREVLKEFRETLKMMIDKREAKLAALEAQIAKLKESLAAAAAPFTELKKGLDTHIVHVKAACAEHTKQGGDVNAKIGEVIGLIKQHHMGGEGSATGASGETGAESEAAF